MAITSKDSRDQIKELTESKVSLVPEGLLEALKAEQIIDLFAYLQSDGNGTAHSGGK